MILHRCMMSMPQMITFQLAPCYVMYLSFRDLINQGSSIVIANFAQHALRLFDLSLADLNNGVRWRILYKLNSLFYVYVIFIWCLNMILITNYGQNSLRLFDLITQLLEFIIQFFILFFFYILILKNNFICIDFNI